MNIRVHNFTSWDQKGKFAFWLSGAKNDTEIYKITGKFVSKLWEERERLMGAIK